MGVDAAIGICWFPVKYRLALTQLSVNTKVVVTPIVLRPVLVQGVSLASVELHLIAPGNSDPFSIRFTELKFIIVLVLTPTNWLKIDGQAIPPT